MQPTKGPTVVTNIVGNNPPFDVPVKRTLVTFDNPITVHLGPIKELLDSKPLIYFDVLVPHSWYFK